MNVSNEKRQRALWAGNKSKYFFALNARRLFRNFAPTLSMSESIMEHLSNVVLTFESVHEILWCDHSNETSSVVLLHGIIYLICVYLSFETVN